MKKYCAKAEKKVKDILSGGPEFIDEMESVLDGLDSSTLSEVEAELEGYLKSGAAKNDLSVQPSLLQLIKKVRDLSTTVTTNFLAIEKFISLNFPPIEDGNNFGVSVQLSIMKMIGESRKEIGVQCGSIGASYFDSRANCVDKVGLKKKSISATSSTSESKSTTTKAGENEAEEKTSSSTSTEEKESGPDAVDDYRMYHLLAIDLKAYNDAKTALSKLINEYCSVVDNVEKNYEKLTAPKGSSGGNNHMGMF